jgi:antitoxin FitA
MATVTVRNLGDSVVKRLKARARINNRSLEAELRQILDRAAANEAAFDRRAAAERIAGMARHPVPDDSVKLIREGRDR